MVLIHFAHCFFPFVLKESPARCKHVGVLLFWGLDPAPAHTKALVGIAAACSAAKHHNSRPSPVLIVMAQVKQQPQKNRLGAVGWVSWNAPAWLPTPACASTLQQCARLPRLNPSPHQCLPTFPTAPPPGGVFNDIDRASGQVRRLLARLHSPRDGGKSGNVESVPALWLYFFVHSCLLFLP